MNQDYKTVLSALGQSDIYLLDQIQKKRILPEHHILDAGCGTGRNLEFFLRCGYPNLFATDKSEEAISQALVLKNSIAPVIPDANFILSPTEKLPFASGSMQVVLSIAVLHFARDEQHFKAMLDEMWRVLSIGGLLFCRLASSIGIEKRIEHLEGRHYLLPDGSKRFLVDETFLLRHTHRLGASFLEPIKTVNVQNTRCMTTWVLGKKA